MIYEEFKPFLLAACFPSDQHHNTLIKEKRGAREGAGGEKTGDKGERRDNVRERREEGAKKEAKGGRQTKD